jgi:hypothetical protein
MFILANGKEWLSQDWRHRDDLREGILVVERVNKGKND